MTDPEWLLAQLEQWPKRVDPERTISPEYLMKSAAAVIRKSEQVAIDALATIERLEALVAAFGTVPKKPWPQCLNDDAPFERVGSDHPLPG